MNNILNQKFDSDDENDDDYVPDAKEIAECERELNKGKVDNTNPEKKAQKIEELWKEMNKDPVAPKTNPAASEDPKPTTPAADSKDTKEVEPSQLDIKKLLEKVNGPKEKEMTMKFAGKEFVRENGELKEIKTPAGTTDTKQAADPKAKTNYLKSVLGVIDAKNINSMTKSKMDWKDYTVKNKLEKNFNENRKDGYIEKRIFLEKAKQNEHAYITSKRKKIDD